MREWIAKEGAERISGVSENTIRRVKVKLQDGINRGDGIEVIAREMVRSGSGIADVKRARVIARTEIISASNKGSLEGARDLEIPLKKVWLATRDNRTRIDHAIADGQEVLMNQLFSVGGDLLDYPGDVKGSISNIIQCRCTQVYQPLTSEQARSTPTPTPTFEPSKEINIGDGVSAKYTDKELDQLLNELDSLGIDFLAYDQTKDDGYMMIASKYLTVQNALAQVQGFRGLPSQLSDDAFRLLAKNDKDYMIAYRGISGSGVNRNIDSFKNGELYGSSGNLYGNGTYFAKKSQYQVARLYADEIDENVLPVLIKKSNLKTIDFVKLQDMRDTERRLYQSKLTDKIKKKYNRVDIYSDEFMSLYPIESRKLQMQMTLYDDLGQYATIKGYDAYTVKLPNAFSTNVRDLFEYTDYIVLLNRTKSVVPQSLRGEL
jgi:hypothetical protein